MKKTPLYEKHLEAGARMGPFGGWDMPIQYAGILAEHNHTRQRTALFDICHMGEFELTGPTAAADLDRLLTQAVGTLAVGQCRYGYLLRDDGGILDDLTCYRLDTERFLLVVNAATAGQDAEWISSHLSDTTQFNDRSEELAKIDIQGPCSREDAEAAFGEALPDLKYFRAVEGTLCDTPVLVSRTGYTGEWGYELYLPVDQAVAFWDRLLANDNIRPGGLGARDTLRLEMGYPLYGHELSLERSPVAASRGLFLAMDTDFIGKETVERDLTEGAPRYLAGLQLETRRAARADDPVMLNDQEIGIVTSGSIAPSLNTAVAMAYVDAQHCEPGTNLQVSVRGKPLAATVVALPFYKEGTARKKASS